jgi:hypothetical protein
MSEFVIYIDSTAAVVFPFKPQYIWSLADRLFNEHCGFIQHVTQLKGLKRLKDSQKTLLEFTI